MKNTFFLVLTTSFFSFFISIAHAMTTTGTSAGVNETVTWSISGISDNDIHFLWRSSPDSSTEIVNYTAPIPRGSRPIVHAEIQQATQLTGPQVQDQNGQPIGLISTQRSLSIDIPDNGTRWEAEKQCSWSYSSSTPSNTCSPPSVELDHVALFRPYQRVPAYPNAHMQADKWISIRDYYFTYTTTSENSSESVLKNLYIYIIPQDIVGLSSDEENGLPKHVRTEPDFKRKKPYGCNSCSAIGLPGYRINMFNLHPVIQDPLFQWGGNGPSLQLRLTWNAGLGYGHTNFGKGWRFSYDAWLEESSSGVTIRQDTGGRLQFDIPFSGNANVVSVNTSSGDKVVTMEYSAPISSVNYTSGWDGKFTSHKDGYNLQKTVDGDPSLRTFTLTPPDKKLSYIFEGPAGTTGPVPLVAIEDWNGNRVQITRNGSGAITQITDAANRTATLTYNQAGQCTLLTVPGGGQIHFDYSGENLVQSIDLIGNRTSYTYNSDQFMTSMITEGRPWLFTWSNSNGHDYVSSVTDPQGAITHYGINTLIQDTYRTQVTDPTGRTFVYQYPSGHYLESDRPQSTKITSDTEGRPVEIYQHGTSNHPRTLEYDGNGNITKMIDYTGGVHTYTYNERNQVTQYVDALNNTWAADYDDHGNRTRIQSPAGRIYQYAYNAQGKLTQEIDPEGNITRYSYDSLGNLKTVTDAEGAVTTYLYDSLGINLTGVTDPLGNTTTFAYDANQRLTRITHPDGTYREYYYDCCAQTGVRNENGEVRTVTRTPSLKVTRETDYLGNTTVNTYDAAGRKVSSRDPQGRITRTKYNELGLAASVQDALGDSVFWTYNINDNLFSHEFCQDPPAEVSEATSTLDISEFGVPAKENGWEYVRDQMGRLLRTITPRDYWKRINYTRDADGLLTGIDVDGTSVATFVRDGNGLLTASTQPALGTDTYVRNGRGQVTRQTWYDGKTADFGYDGAGRLHSLTYPDGSSALYGYDSRGRITSVSWKGQTLTTQYDAVGNIVREIRSNGITTDIIHDKNGMPTRIHHYAGTQEYLDLQGVRNPSGMITRIQKSGNVLTWGSQLTPETTNSTFTYGRSFTVVSRNGQTATTDPAGNQTSIPGPRAFSGTYNFFDLLTDWTASGSSNSALYDGQRRLLQWSRNGEKRKFHYDERGRLLFETNDADVITASWLYRENQVIAMADSNGMYFYHNDLSGNISFLSNTSGTVVAHYNYLPFGLKTNSAATINNPFTFVGSFGVLDLHDGLYYMGSRMYDAVIRAFLSNDPVGMGVTANARQYAADNPVNLIDPDGRSSRGSSEWGEWMRSDWGNRNSSGPNWGYPPPAPKGTSKSTFDPCEIGTALWNAAGTTKEYGDTVAVLTILNDLRQGNYGDAVYDIAGTAIGKANPYAGAVSTFMGANPAGLPPDKEAELIQKAKNDPNSYFNQHTKHSPSYGDFTVPPFSLDD